MSVCVNVLSKVRIALTLGTAMGFNNEETPYIP